MLPLSTMILDLLANYGQYLAVIWIIGLVVLTIRTITAHLV